jgi:hypothetical protein
VAQGSATAFFARLARKRRTIPQQSSHRKGNSEDDKMAVASNGVASSNGSMANPASPSARCPRRIVLLRAGEDSEVEQILAEYQGKEISGKLLHADVQRLAEEHRGHSVAAEWLGPLGWTRFLWCRR